MSDMSDVRKKQDAFLDKWISGEGVEFANDAAKSMYQERAGLVAAAFRIDDSIKRVPIMPLTTFAPTMLKGISGKEAMYNPEAAGQAYLDFCNAYEPDTAGSAPMLMYGPAIETLQYNLYKWPGHGVAENLSYQFHEKEYMKPDEYDHLISDPTDFFSALLDAQNPWSTGSIRRHAAHLRGDGTAYARPLADWHRHASHAGSSESPDDSRKAML